MMIQTKRIYILLCALAVVFFTVCSCDRHEDTSVPFTESATLRLLLELPSTHLPDYTKKRDAGYSLRCVVEVFRKGTNELVHRQTVLPTPVADGSGRYLLELNLNQSTYDLYLWTDYVPQATTGDYHYKTDNLKSVGFNPERSYTACTDSRDAAYATLSISLTKELQEETVAMQRPLAKYRLIATDVEPYRKLAANGDCPPLDELTATVFYEGFFPSSFNVSTGSPNDATTDIFYEYTLPEPESDATQMQIGSDWVMVNGDDTFVRVTVRITDCESNIISQASGVRINYRSNHLTTIRGQFLTAGKVPGGIHVDTVWGGEYIIGF